MADRLPALDEPDHSDEWTYAYLDGELSEVEKSAFAEHMKTHAECRDEVATMRVVLPVFADVLMEDGFPRTGAEYAEIAKAAESKLKSRPSTSLGASGGRRRWSWGGLGFAGLAAAVASLFFFVQQLSGLEPTLLRAAAAAPLPETGEEPPQMIAPELVDLSTSVHFSRLNVAAPRDAGDVYTAVGLLDAKGKRWLVQSGEAPDPSCSPGCGPLELRVKLDALAPGPFRVAALLSAKPIPNSALGKWLPDAGLTVPQWIGARAFGAARVDR